VPAAPCPAQDSALRGADLGRAGARATALDPALCGTGLGSGRAVASVAAALCSRCRLLAKMLTASTTEEKAIAA
jgi:hypothetical protein